MNSFHSNSFLMILPLVIYLLSFYPVAMQEMQPSEEMQLLKDCLTFYNITEEKYQDISEKMKDVKYNILIKIRYNNLKKKKNKVDNKMTEIKEKIGKNNYDKNAIIQEIKELKIAIMKFDAKCDKTIHVYYQNDDLKKIIIHMIKVFFNTLFVIIIIALVIIGVVSYFVIKRQRQYQRLEEEVTHIEEIDESKNHNNEIVQIKNEINTERIDIMEENKDNLESTDRKEIKEENEENKENNENKESEQIDDNN